MQFALQGIVLEIFSCLVVSSLHCQTQCGSASAEKLSGFTRRNAGARGRARRLHISFTGLLSKAVYSRVSYNALRLPAEPENANCQTIVGRHLVVGRRDCRKARLQRQQLFFQPVFEKMRLPTVRLSERRTIRRFLRILRYFFFTNPVDADILFLLKGGAFP